MSKKKAKPKHAALKPRTAWVIVKDATGQIPVGHPGQLHVYRRRRDAAAQVLDNEHPEKVLITKA